VEILRKKQPNLKRKRVQRDKTNSAPPIGVPSWCLNKEALEKLNRAADDIIPVYTDEEDIEDDENDNDNANDNDLNNENRGKRKKSKKSLKRKSKQKKDKKHKSGKRK
jgi:hypothetical protein